MIKLFCADIDGTLTDGTVYYSKNGEELKQFSHIDGRGFHLLHHNHNVICALITSESAGINKARFEKFKKLGTVKDFCDDIYGNGKLEKIKFLCNKYSISSDETAFIGDDTNDLEALNFCKYKACPYDANHIIKKVKGIKILRSKGGQGAVREYIDYIIRKRLV